MLSDTYLPYSLPLVLNYFFRALIQYFVGSFKVFSNTWSFHSGFHAIQANSMPRISCLSQVKYDLPQHFTQEKKKSGKLIQVSMPQFPTKHKEIVVSCKNIRMQISVPVHHQKLQLVQCSCTLFPHHYELQKTGEVTITIYSFQEREAKYRVGF